MNHIQNKSFFKHSVISLMHIPTLFRLSYVKSIASDFENPFRNIRGESLYALYLLSIFSAIQVLQVLSHHTTYKSFSNSRLSNPNLPTNSARFFRSLHTRIYTYTRILSHLLKAFRRESRRLHTLCQKSMINSPKQIPPPKNHF